MRIDLTDAEKTVLANYLTEQRCNKMKEILEPLGEELAQNYKDKQFEFYNEVLKETDDY